ncbi:hypothetical protein LEP1GSC034_0920 [Leptospira interrogans str. 2003000735]|uniref:Phage tail protein n=2 Tax=Leptospira interrogans TaxID=173 RepID=A0A829D0S3_LEPIR|nr:hypothetical protein [Leptospira interrogans]EMY03917.1 hypothetical protein LEP1GSC029_3811 [Leptospira interrogans str. 2002000626]EMY26795.1 hypothetical protein LEP1GSC115_4489 [Leptospira interrogans serovar Australis str. 200703203]EKN86859.1 hypothetical protein LEP1GSC027_2506 [Leptospira interrogans str. 2002000624]EKQ37065.1 hypothetical protein LEP1GSC025_1423 [Leptospira interrogans str. 2002000621]EKQ46500.1 hypothetical protein LEP1GSC026_1094 [Leptospira interrogans str. 2002
MSNLRGLNFPTNGKPVFQGDFETEHNRMEDEIIERFSDLVSGEVLSGGDLTPGASPNTINLTEIVAYDSKGRRIRVAAQNNLLVTRQNLDSFVVLRHKFQIETSSYLDSSGYANTYRQNSFEILFKETTDSEDVVLFKIRSLNGAISILNDLRSLCRIKSGNIRDNSVTNSKLDTDIKVGSLSALVGRFNSSRSSISSALNALESWISAEEATRQNDILGLTNLIVPLGGIVEDSLNILSSSYFKDANAQVISRVTFSALWNLVRRNVTGIVAATDRISCTNHGCIEGQLVKFSFTGGGITALTNYYVRNPTTNDFQISSTSTGSILDLTSSQTGEMIINIEYGFGDGSSTFNVPDRRGIFPRGAGIHGTRAKAAGGNYDGGAVGYAGQDLMFDHRHNFTYNNPFGLIGGAGSYWMGAGGTNAGNTNLVILEPMTDGINGTPRRGNETTPAYIAVKYKVRVA